VVFESAWTPELSITTLDSSHVVIGYGDAGNSKYGTAIVGTVSGSSISFGSAVVFEAASTFIPSVAALDNSHVVIAYKDAGNSNYGTAIVGSVSGSSISFGSAVVFESASTQYISVAALDSSHVVVAYRDDGNSNYGTAIVGSVSGSSISFGSAVVFESETTSWVSISALDSSHVVIAYQEDEDGPSAPLYDPGVAIVGTVVGNSISFGSSVVFESATTKYVSVSSLDSSHVVIGYQDDDNSGYGTAIVGMVTGGDTIGFSDAVVFESATTYFPSVAALDSSHVVIGYADNGNSNYGTAIVGSYGW